MEGEILFKKQKSIKSSIIIFTMLFIIICTSISPILAANTNNLGSSPWPLLGHDAQNTGQSQYLGAQKNISKWNYSLNEGNYNIITGGTVIGKDGNIYFGMEYYNGTRTTSRLYSIYPNGKPRWNVTINKGTNSWGIVPVIGADGTIYFTNQIDTNTGEEESLYAYNPDGSLKWFYNFNDGLDGNSMPLTIGSDGTLYVGTGFNNGIRNLVKFYGFYPNGTPKWNRSIADGDWNSIWTLPAIGKDGSIIFGTYFENKTDLFGKLYALDSNGNIKWSYIPKNINISESSLAPSIASDGTIYIGTTNYNKDRHWINLFALNPDGTLKWNKKFFDGTTNMVLGATSVSASGIIYFISNFKNSTGSFGNIYALNPDGSIKWNYLTSASEYSWPVIGSDGTIYFSLSKGILALNSDGTKKWFYNGLGNGFASIDKDGTIYLPVHSTNDMETSKYSVVAIKGQTSDLYLKTSVDNTNPKVGDKLTITFKVGNNGPDTAYYTIMKFLIPAGLKFISANADSGIWSYNETTKTITWNLGDVPVGDHYLKVVTKVLGANTIDITPILNTLTYDPNLVNNVQAISVNVQPNSTNTTNNNTNLNTVGMQNTGIPIPLTVLAVLMVIGGLVGARRK